jgi:methyltransferase family protein
MEFSIPNVRGLADDENPNSFSNKLRARRFRQFEALAAALPRPLRILDVGGTNDFWEKRGWAGREDVQIFSVNLFPEKQRHENVTPLTGNATDLAQFADHSFDIAFSNSVIEHLFTLESQRRMASEIQRVGKAFWVQTPNFWFPMEPHFQVPGWQWMPLDLRIAIIRRWRCGWRGPCSDAAAARQLVEEVRLLTRTALQAIFPGATLIPERFCGLVKSWTVAGGFPTTHVSPSPTREGKA